jgi:hypothetical protein
MGFQKNYKLEKWVSDTFFLWDVVQPLRTNDGPFLKNLEVKNKLVHVGVEPAIFDKLR